MSKRFIAALLALSMCAGFAGCGKNSGNSADEKSSRSANNTTKEEDTASTKDGKMKLTDLDPENILYRDNTSTDSDKPTMEESLMLAELALEQYSAAQSGDAEKYKKTLNLEKNLDSMAESIMKVDDYFSDGNISVKNYAAVLGGITLIQTLDENTKDKVEEIVEDKNASVQDYDKLIKQAYENFEPDKQEEGIWSNRAALQPLGEIDDKTVLQIVISDFIREGDDMIMGFDIVVLNGDNKFSLDRIAAWTIDGDNGVIMGNADCGENEYAGMTGKEIEEAYDLRNSKIQDTDEAAAKVYEAVSVYFAKKAEEGVDAKTVLETGFPICSSSSGLDISGDFPDAEGDQSIFTALSLYEIFDGTVSFGPLDEEKGMPEYVIYTAKDGTATKYPDNSED